ncbi:hypothetical protein CDL12_05582 [Handroanthus impetiginosus]|uniref:Ubiquitinyl hydrolase 1 n=1 Tax=Handroanthus impetiginosus TaxID=429701 RepID=A0A2G9HW14_9LAMI|nr:hypothetical protein CDL12_05582 [Handroanthus impetiginosus]
MIEFFQLYLWGECKLPNKVHDIKDRLKSITAEMIFEFNPTSQELCLLNSDSTVAAIVRAKDQEIKELKKRVAELEATTNKNLWVLALGGEDEEKKDEEDEEMDEEWKDDEDEKKKEKDEENDQKEKKIEEGHDDKKGEKENGENEEGKKKESEKEEERKDGGDDEERDHDADNEYNDMNKENQTKYHAGQVSCHNEVEMNKKLEEISRKLNFGQDVNFDECDYEAVRTLSSIVDGV